MEGKKEYFLDNIKLEFNKYGEYKGEYTGTVTFSNEEYESFRFKIYPEMAHQFIQLISGEIVKGAESLSNDLLNSLKLNKKDDIEQSQTV